jgi:colicin import membrane protein
MMVPLREYFLPTLASLALHGLLVWAVVHVWQEAVETPIFKTPEFVKATLVELKTKAPERKIAAINTNKVDLTADKKLNASIEKERLQKEAAAKQARIAKEKEAQEAQEKAAKEKAAKEKERLEKATAEKRAKEEARKRQQEAIDQALQEEEIMLAEQAEAEIVNSFKAIIYERIVQKWSRPPSARRGMRCNLVIQLVPTGKIISVTVATSSGSDAFDRSAEQAVRAVDQIPELQNMDIALFEKEFRTINILFNPEDLRL